MEAQQPAYPPPYQPDEIIQALLEKQLENPLSIGDFEGRVGETFTVIEGDQSLELELVEAARLEVQAGAPCQEPGSLLFRIPKECSVAPRLYRVTSQGHEDITLFLGHVVGDASDSEHHFLESVFN